MYERRSCTLHKENPVIRLCLKDVCECKGVLCQDCILQFRHRNSSHMIDEDSQLFQLFRTNSNKPKQSEQFEIAIQSLRNIWSHGISIIQRQSLKLESTFLLQLNLMYKTFDQYSPRQMVESLLHQYCQQSNMDLQNNVKMVKMLNKYQNNLKNIQKIKQKTRNIYLKVSKELQVIFRKVQEHFQSLSVILDMENIFQIENEKQSAQISTILNMLKTVKDETLQKINEPKIEALQPISQPQQRQYTKRQILTIDDDIIGTLVSNNMQKFLKLLIVKPIINVELVIGSFLEKTYQLQEIIVQSPNLANQTTIPIFLMNLPKLKSLVLNCNNQVWKCIQEIYYYDGTHKNPLNRFQYFYDFKRGIEQFDNTKFFLKQKATLNIFYKTSISNKLKNNKILGRKSPSNKAVFEMTKRLLVNNIWIAYLSNSDLSLKLDSYDLTKMQQMTLGHYSKQCYIIPSQFIQKLKQSKNLKCLTLIKNSHPVNNLQGLLSHLNLLEVLIMDEVTLLGNDDRIQALFNKLPTFCPLIQKLSINNLKNVDISFIQKLPKLRTLILIGGKQLRFTSDHKLVLSHLNLFQSNWNYLDLLRSLSHQKITTLNLGFTKFHFKDIFPIIKTFVSLSNLCIDKLLLGPELEQFCLLNIYNLEQLSISHCHSKLIFGTPQGLLNSKILRLLDISKSDLEGLMLKKIPESVKFLVLSSKNLLHQNQQEKLSARGVKIVEYQT